MKHLSLLAILAVLCMMAACHPGRTANPQIVSAGQAIAVAPFMQPRDPSQLIVGNIPPDQGEIPPGDLDALDQALREVLGTRTSRAYSYLEPNVLAEVFKQVRSTGQPQAMQAWLAYGKSHHLDYLLVPQIIDWHERAGSEAGVTESAHVRAEFFLINVPASILAGRSVYEVKQVGLAENLLTVTEFFKRRGRWVTATQLATEGMENAVQELGL